MITFSTVCKIINFTSFKLMNINNEEKSLIFKAKNITGPKLLVLYVFCLKTLCLFFLTSLTSIAIAKIGILCFFLSLFACLLQMIVRSRGFISP